MIVAGGVYQELCRFPRWERIFGSGLRAALAVSELTPRAELHGYVPEALARDVAATLASFGIANQLRPSATAFTFQYLHPFEKWGWKPDKWDAEAQFCVDGEAVLRFGVMESNLGAVVTARRAVYDPQSPHPVSFGANGSRADELVIIGTPDDILTLAGKRPAGGRPDEDEIRDAVANLNDTETGLKAVVLKDRLGGLTLYQGDEGVPVPTYAAESYFRIGAGDIIAAGFAYAWAEKQLAINEAADFAARCLAYAVEGPRFVLDANGIAAVKPGPSAPPPKLRILGGDTLELQVLSAHTQDLIKDLGGEATIDEEVEGAHVNLLLVGEPPRRDVLQRLSEVARRGPSVVYWPEAQSSETRLWFGDVVHARDFSTALYRAVRMIPE